MLQIFAIIDDTSVMNFGKNLQHNFPKMRGGGSKAIWNFSENSSVLEGVGFPYRGLGLSDGSRMQSDLWICLQRLLWLEAGLVISLDCHGDQLFK